MTMTLENHLKSGAAAQALRRDVREGLSANPKYIPPKWFYDATGSDLFDEITRLPEYYPTRTEASILRDNAAEIAALAQVDTLVELGSGTSEKTRILLDALRHKGLRSFVPFDVDAGILRAAGGALVEDYPGMRVHAVCGDFEENLDQLPRTGKRLLAFLGSTIGNLTTGPRSQFLAAVAAQLDKGEMLLLGTDLIKDASRLVQAYDDSAGVTAAFNRNVLAVINRELNADFDVDSFEHTVVWNPVEERIEMWLRSAVGQQVTVRDLGLQIEFTAGEQILTEVSCKFRRDGVADELARSGLRLVHWWTDELGDFGLSLAVKE